jgi:hypothetical protein
MGGWGWYGLGCLHGWGPFGQRGAHLFGFFVLLSCSPLALLIGEPPDFFGTDLGETPPLEQAGGYAIGPGTGRKHGRFL